MKQGCYKKIPYGILCGAHVQLHIMILKGSIKPEKWAILTDGDNYQEELDKI